MMMKLTTDITQIFQCQNGRVGAPWYKRYRFQVFLSILPVLAVILVVALTATFHSRRQNDGNIQSVSRI